MVHDMLRFPQEKSYIGVPEIKRKVHNMTAWQQLLRELSHPRIPHRWRGNPRGLADAIAEALLKESLCVCERCPADNWTERPIEALDCPDCAVGHHGPPAVLAW